MSSANGTECSFDPVQLVRENDRHYQWLLRLAQLRFHKPEAQLECLTLTADFAQFHHTGRFADGELERIAVAIGRDLKPTAAEWSRSYVGSTRHVLHVATTVSRVGGHTRTIGNWMRTDTASRHSIFLTEQIDGTTPDWLPELTLSARGSFHKSPVTLGRLQRAAALRSAAATADLIVLHTHPQDLIPVVALAEGCSTPVALVNHADHIFWVGGSVTDVAFNLREIGLRLSEERRGLRSNTLLPIPLTDNALPPREVARLKLGISADDLALVSVGRALKYRPNPTHNFFKAAGSLLERLSHARLFLVGVSHAQAEKLAGGRLPPRLHCVGQVDDTGPYLAAADLYLEGFPFGSQTALLEAALAGLPVVPAYAPPLELVATSDAALGGLVAPAASISEYLDRVVALGHDRDTRVELGRLLRERTLECHVGDGWRSKALAAYQTAEGIGHAVSDLPATQRLERPTDLALGQWLHQMSDQQVGTTSAVEHIREMVFSSAYRLRCAGDTAAAIRLLSRSILELGGGSRELVSLAKLPLVWGLRNLTAVPPPTSPPSPPPQVVEPRMSGRHIGVFTSVKGMGGSEVAVADVIEGVLAAGGRVTCWAPPAAAIRSILANRGLGERVTLFDWPSRLAVVSESSITPPTGQVGQTRAAYRKYAPEWVRTLTGFFREATEFRDELRRVQPDLVFLNVNASEGAVLGARAALGRRVVSCYHLSVGPTRLNLFARVADWAKKVLSMWASPSVVHVSEAVRNQWCRLCFYPRSWTRVIHNGVEAVAVDQSPAAVRAGLGVREDEFLVCVPGRLHPMKGHAHLVDALALAPTAFDRCQVLICGDGAERQRLEDRVSAAGLGHVVRFLGWRADLPRLLAASDCTLLPSVESENLSVAVLESLMAGIPAIVTQVGGMAEAVRDGVTGYVVPPADPAALHRALLRCLAEPDAVSQLGRNAQADARERFTRQRMMADYVGVFSDMLTTH